MDRKEFRGIQVVEVPPKLLSGAFETKPVPPDFYTLQSLYTLNSKLQAHQTINLRHQTRRLNFMHLLIFQELETLNLSLAHGPELRPQVLQTR